MPKRSDNMSRTVATPIPNTAPTSHGAKSSTTERKLSDPVPYRRRLLTLQKLVFIRYSLWELPEDIKAAVRSLARDPQLRLQVEEVVTDLLHYHLRRVRAEPSPEARVHPVYRPSKDNPHGFVEFLTLYRPTRNSVISKAAKNVMLLRLS